MPFVATYLTVFSVILSVCGRAKVSVLILWHVFRMAMCRLVVSPNRLAEDLKYKQEVITIKKYRIMNIKPLADRVLVLPAPAEEKVGGIIIPDTAKEKPQRGKVVATGKGTKDEEMILKEGDTVLYGKYAGTELEFDGTKYMMMRQSDVLAVVEE